MLGTNPIRAPKKGDGLMLDVVSIFPTLQGEGPYAGHPAIFIRLGGCNLACHFCDTEFEAFTPRSLDSICDDVGAHGAELAVVTGGEPLLHPIAPLCERLIAMGKKVQIESNGTLWRDIPEEVAIVCSPKMSNGVYHPVRPDILARAHAIKFIVSAHDALYREVPEVGQRAYGVPVYVQPMDEKDEAKNDANRAYAIGLCMQHGYRLSLQLHKILGIE